MEYSISKVKGNGGVAIVPKGAGTGLVLREKDIEDLIAQLQAYQGEKAEEIDPFDDRIFDSLYIGYREASGIIAQRWPGNYIPQTTWSYVARKGTIAGAVMKEKRWYIPRDKLDGWAKGQFETMTREEYQRMKEEQK